MFFRNNKIDTLAIAKQAVAQLKTDNSRMRRASMKKRIDYYNGKQLTYLDELLDSQFKMPDRLKLQKEFYNVTEMIINELAVLYSQPPKRELCDCEDEESESVYQDIIEKAKLDATMATANKYAKLCKVVLVRPVWRGKIEYDIYTPNMFDVIQDPQNPTKPLGIIYANQLDMVWSKPVNNDNKTTLQDPFSLPNTIFYVWTKEAHFAFTYAMNKSSEVVIEMVKNENNADNKNPYEMLPFVAIYDGVPTDGFFVEGGDDLINANEINNVKLVEKNNLTKMQSFSIPVRKGADSTKDEMTLDPSMIVDIPADDDMRKGSDFKFVSPEAKIAEIEADLEGRLRRLAIKNKLNPDMFIASGNRSSADSLQLQNYHLGKIITADKPLYAGYEKELFEITRVVYNYHSEEGQLPEECELFIDYKDIEVPMTVEQEDSHNTILYTNKLMSRADWLMKENPDIKDKDQALEKLAEIDAEEAEYKAMQVQAGVMATEEPQLDANGQPIQPMMGEDGNPIPPDAEGHIVDKAGQKVMDAQGMPVKHPAAKPAKGIPPKGSPMAGKQMPGKPKMGDMSGKVDENGKPIKAGAVPPKGKKPFGGK